MSLKRAYCCPVIDQPAQSGQAVNRRPFVQIRLPAAVKTVHEQLVAMVTENVSGDSARRLTTGHDFEYHASSAQQEAGETRGRSAVHVDRRDSE